ncbi:MAG: ABC transporter ATP-binding protein [Synergistaceae bacterium]|nr:ABC transporter ATP-binding protein [Synergistaceae bacterium]
MPQILCENLSLGYGAKTVIKNLNFSVNEGDYLCIIGENGTGKTTLMKTILGLQPPLNGKIIFGEGLNAKKIGYLPQQTEVQRDFPASVWEIVLSGFQGHCGLRPFYNKKEKNFALHAIKKMNIEEIKSRCYRELSGGQQQRVLLARALCAAEKIIFLDEPVAGLDPQAASEMYKLIKELNQNDGITIIMISHDVDEALNYASHILEIGKKFFFGTKQEYKK